jgi:O-antigen/teichoic acid export membrane protein
MNQGWVSYLPAFLKKRVEGRQELQKVLNNTGWLFGDRLLRMGVGLVVGVWIARYLGPPLFGELSFAGSLMALFAPLATLGLESIVVRDIVRSPENDKEIVGTTFLLRLFAAFVSYILLYATILVLRPDDKVVHSLVAVMGFILIFNAFDAIDLWFQAKVLSKYVVLAKNTAFLVSAGTRIAFVLLDAPLIAFAIANVVEYGLGAFGLVLVYSRKGESIRRWSFSTRLAKNLLLNGWPIILAGIVSIICFRVDQVMLGQMVDSREVGVYAAAVRVAEIWYFIPAAIVASVFPNIVKARHVDESEFYSRIQKLYNLLAFLGYAVAIPMTFLSGFVVTLLFGEAYSGAAPMLAVLIWSGVFINLSIARGSYLMAMNWPWVLLTTSVVAALANILLNLILIPKYGGMGAAVASLLSYWIGAHGVCYFYKPLYKTGKMLTRALLLPRFW